MTDEDHTAARADALTRQAASMRAPLAAYFRRRVRNASEVEDLVQEVFLRLTVRGAPETVERGTGYIFQTAASVLADRHRRRTVRHADDHVALDPELHGEQDFDPARLYAGKEALNVAAAVLMTMPDRTRAIFVLRRLEGYSHQDIASQLRISVSAVRKHMSRAVEHLMAHAGEDR